MGERGKGGEGRLCVVLGEGSGGGAYVGRVAATGACYEVE
jgi:hypothetical protein